MSSEAERDRSKGGARARILEILRPEIVHPVPPYTALAPIYDGVMRHVNYKRWAKYIRQVADLYGVATGRVLDLACGTGSFLGHFLRKAYLGFGCDSSEPMVRVAQNKLSRKTGFRLAWVADMRRPGCRGPFDLVVCLYDSINYLERMEDYGRVLAAVADVLRPGGLFIFDVCTVRNSLVNFDGFHEQDRVGKNEFLRLSYFQPDSGLQVNEFLIGRKGELEEETFLEVHRQWIRPLELVKEQVQASELELLGMYDDYSFREGTEDSLRVHFVCRRT